MTNRAEPDTTRKIALVTGGAGALGAAAARFLQEDGYRIVLADIDEQHVASVARQIGAGVVPIAFDVSSPDEAQHAVERVTHTVGTVDLLLNNAGIVSLPKSQDLTVAEWKRVLAVNLDGAFYLSRAVIPGMKAKGWGRIINTCSLAGKNGGLTVGTAYATSKGALIALTYSLAAETASFGITVNGIAPAFVRTQMIENQLSSKQKEEILRKIPVGRMCEPDEFAHVVRFLASPLAGFITGEIIDQNGGLLVD
jgi:3-oxoacyl-[acyl-carrier protein] reductase